MPLIERIVADYFRINLSNPCPQRSYYINFE